PWISGWAIHCSGRSATMTHSGRFGSERGVALAIVSTRPDRPVDRRCVSGVRDTHGRYLIAISKTLSESFASPARPRVNRKLRLGYGSSVVDCLDTKLLEAFDGVLHRLED